MTDVTTERIVSRDEVLNDILIVLLSPKLIEVKTGGETKLAILSRTWAHGR